MKTKKRMWNRDVKIVMTGPIGAVSLNGIKNILKSAEMSVGMLKTDLIDREKRAAAVKKAGITVLLGEDENALEDVVLHRVKNITVGMVVFHKDEEENFAGRIAAARGAGADFVVAYVNCTAADETSRLKAAADGGADYILGYGRKKIGSYTVLSSEHGSKVSAVRSIGTLYRNQGAAVLLELQLRKEKDGTVLIRSQGYYPCQLTGTVIPLDEAWESGDVEQRLDLEEMLFQIKGSMGVQSEMQCLRTIEDVPAQMMQGNVTEAQSLYEVQPVLTAPKTQKEKDTKKNPYLYHQQKGYYYRAADSAEREALLTCTGHIEYGGQLELDAECFGSYEFLKSFKAVSACFADSDFVIGNLGAMASPQYPSVGDVSLKTRRSGYYNVRTEFVQALQKAGFSGIAAANQYNACLGIEGIFDTEQEIRKRGMISSGIGRAKNPIVEINGIRIGILSVTTGCLNVDSVLTGEATTRFLNIFDREQTKNAIADLRRKEVEFILVYAHCGMNKKVMDLEERKAVAEAIAEMGADYVICTGNREADLYYRYETADHRVVPVATSLGCFLTGKKSEAAYESAILKINIRRDFDGHIYADDKYVPIRIYNQYEGVQNAIVPVPDTESESAMAETLGGEIKRHKKRIIDIHSTYTRTPSIEEIYQILGKEPGESDLERFGEKYRQPVSCVSVTKRLMKEDGVAVIFKGRYFNENTVLSWPIERCIEAGVSLVIDDEYHPEIPTIVLDEPPMLGFEKLMQTVRNWYNPVTVAITGSMGKTSTKEMATRVFETTFRTACASGNNNAIFQTGNLLQALEDGDEALIQEVHGGTKGTAACVSRVVSPDIAIITNIVPNHMSQIGTMENLIEAKLGIIDGLKPDGVLILCDDNEHLRNVNPPVRTIRYSLTDVNAHYHVENIKEEGETVSFEIVSRESEFDQAGRYPAKLYTRGVHNVSNALAVFAAGRQAGIPPYKIVAGLSRYRTTGIRQNLFDHNGIKVLMDAYNSNPKALLAMFDVFDQLQPEEDGRKILVLGMMGEQGDGSLQIHYETGKAICQHPFDILFCYGEDAKQLAAAAKECGRKAYYFDDRAVFNRTIADTVRPGDVVLVKGSHSMELDTETMVPIYGRTIRQN